MNSPVTVSGRVSVGSTTRPLSTARRFTVGRTPDNDLDINHPLVSRRHLGIEWRGRAWYLVDLGSTNGVFVDGRRITELPISTTTRVLLGDATTGAPVTVVLEQVRPGPPPRPVVPPKLHAAPHMQSLLYNIGDAARPDTFALQGAQTIGRTPDNDIVVADVLASRHHARVIASPQGLLLEDLGSANGTHVNGHRIPRRQPVPVSDGAVITIGNSDLVVAGRTLTKGRPPSTISGGLDVEGVGFVVEGTKRLLHDISLAARPGSLTAVIGPSGAGKSTVSRIIAGINAPSTGRVRFEGRDIHAEYETLRTRIGMVPQRDVLHHKLTLRQALRYAAELRLPPDLNAADRDAVIAGVLDELQLTEHVDTRVEKLSGGQQKRASVALELLTGPSLLILDEPTSGLDPALDRQVMATLRRLADAGRVVVVVTHSLTHLSMCDQVLLLAPGGKTAFSGPPGDVGPAMGTTDWADIFAFVADQPDAAHQRHLARSRPRPPAPPPAAPPGVPEAVPQSSGFGQCSTIARRQVRLIFADRGYLIFLMVMPVVLGLLTLVIPGDYGFAVDRPRGTGTEAIMLLLVLVIGGTFMGAALTIRDLVGERDIFERERAVGLRPGAYLGAKVLVFFAAAIAQSAIMLAITYVGKGLPGSGVVLPGSIELFCAVAALACVSTVVGLAISSAVKSTEQTMPPLVIVIIAQIVFSGGLFHLSTPGLAQLSWIFPSYWGYAAAAQAVDLNRLAPQPPADREALWDPTIAHTVICYGMLGVLTLVLLAFTYSRLRLARSR
ncbi:FHA domain-containing protein [Gordonia sp. CPCC 205515]|uniref:FHA domain-containing protein n=1 Tax=Gordonia sp. CPCC 205515 TaxID=3140791 RepID=UPI003AF3C0D0